MRKKQHNRSKPCLILPVLNRLPSDRNSAFGDFPTTSSAKRRLRRDRPGAGLRQALLRSIRPRRNPHRRTDWRHALSLFGDIKYPADFKRFDYVNPDAPKGGVARLISIGTFDNFNIVVAGVKGIDRAGGAR